MQRRPTVISVAGVTVEASWTLLAAGQLPLAPVGTSGQTITPVYEGWYENPDGTFSLSWGYFNSNSKEIVEIPIGADNRVEPGGPDNGQPTHFDSRRQRGVFTVVVPANFGDNEVNWPLSFRGDTQTIPGTCIATGCSTHWEVGPAATRHRSSDSPRTARSTADRATHRRNH